MFMKGSEVEILMVEDNPDDAALAIRALKKHNLANHILHLKNGEEALDYLFGIGQFEGRDVSEKPKLILLDLKMPKVDGMEVLSALKGDSRTMTIPVVVLTSSQEDPDVRRCYELGANSYIVKPVVFDNFVAAMTKIGMYWLMLNRPPS
jgi:two-component system, response regulator